MTHPSFAAPHDRKTGQFVEYIHPGDDLDLAAEQHQSAAFVESRAAAHLTSSDNENEAAFESALLSDSEIHEDEALYRLNVLRWDIKTVTADGKTTQILLDKPAEGGYDEIRETVGGTVSTYRNGKLHNTAGYAVDRHQHDNGIGDLEVHIDGERIPEPDNSGLLFTGADEAPGRGYRMAWAVGDNSSAITYTDGEKLFYYDGQLHRDGMPAVITSDGVEHWYRYGKHIASPMPKAPYENHVGTEHRGYTQLTGTKYLPGRDIVDIAADIRKDLKTALGAGVLPHGAEFRVRTTRDSQANGITITIGGVPSHGYINPKREEPGQPWRTETGQKLADDVDKIANAYNQWQTGNDATPSATAFYLNSTIQPERA